MTLCTYSYFLPVVVLFAGAIAIGARNEAWRQRKPGVTWLEGPGDIALLRPSLFTEEGNRLRRRAAFWFVVTFVLSAVTVVAAFKLVGPDGTSCWRG